MSDSKSTTPNTNNKQKTSSSKQALDLAAIDVLLQDRTANQALPGLVAGIADSQQTLYQGASGFSDCSSGAAMKTDTIISIASMTKAITSAACMQLVERGDLDLDQCIDAFFPELKQLQVLEGFNEDGSMQLRQAASVPTLRELLTHTSGYVYEIWNANAQKSVASGQVGSFFTDQEGFDAPLAFDPGSRFEYGIGIDWAGKLVELVSGMGLDEYMQKHIFGPLDMLDSFYQVPEDKLARKSALHMRTDEGFTVVPALGGSVSGGAGLHSTVNDYLRFMRSLMNSGTLDGQRILEANTVEMMFENHIGDIRVGPSPSQIPELSNPLDLTFAAQATWGLGFLRHEQQTAMGRPAGSVSWAGLFNSFFWIDRENDLCAMIAAQLLPFLDDNAYAALQSFEQAIYRQVYQQ